MPARRLDVVPYALVGATLALCTMLMPAGAQSWSDRSPHTTSFVVIRNGLRLHYLDWGGSGAAMVFLGGLNTTAHVFDGIAPQFTDRFRVLALTRRGIGQSDKPTTGYDTDELVADTRAFLDSLHIPRVILVGFSIAGVELTRFAALYPDRVDRLVYLDATPVHSSVSSAELQELPVPAAPAVGERVSPRFGISDTVRLKIAFQPSSYSPPSGYQADSGESFGSRRNGWSYGWSQDNRAQARSWPDSMSRKAPFRGAIGMRRGYDNLTWGIELPNGLYQVHVVVGSPTTSTAAYAIEANGVPLIDEDALPTQRWFDGLGTLEVSDHRLTLRGMPWASGNALAAIEISGFGAQTPLARLASLTEREPLPDTTIVYAIRRSWEQFLPGVDVQPAITDDLEHWLLGPNGTIERRYPRRIDNMVDALMSSGDLAHIDDSTVAKPALFVRAIPPRPTAADRLPSYLQNQELKKAKLDAYQRNGPHIQIVELNNTVHMCFIQRPVEVVQLMRAFLVPR